MDPNETDGYTYDHTDHAAESIDRMERMREEIRADSYPDSFADDEYE